jgi:hypothetical protein
MVSPTQAIAGYNKILAALERASSQTGSDFDYLLSTATRESGLKAEAKSKTSSATGLFQFIEQTWLGLVKRFGGRHGLADYAGAIQQSDNGSYTVASADTKAAILALRQKPEVSALMAGEAAKESKQSLETMLGRALRKGELYVAHFLGQDGARHLIQLNDTQPDARADAAFPHAARANQGVFFHADGTAKTIGEVYAWAAGRPSDDANGAYPQGTPAKAVTAAGVDVAGVDAPQTDDQAPQDESAAGVHVKRSGVHLASASPARSGFLPTAPLLLTPAVVEILASLAPFAPTARREKN